MVEIGNGELTIGADGTSTTFAGRISGHVNFSGVN
jgi:hypothetical protein